MFHVYIPGLAETTTDSAKVARCAYAELLKRDDLLGQPVQAVLERDGKPLYESRFDLPLGAGRLHPELPLDVLGTVAACKALHSWRPSA